MKKLFMALVAASTMLLAACSSCLGRTPTPGEAAPQADAPSDTQSMVRSLDSLLKAGDGANFYGILANVPEKMMDVADTAQAREYLMQLQEFLTQHKEQIADLVKNTSDPTAAQELPGLVQFFSDDEQLKAVFSFIQPATDLADNADSVSEDNTNQQ